jgi:hypothetical protein
VPRGPSAADTHGNATLGRVIWTDNPAEAEGAVNQGHQRRGMYHAVSDTRPTAITLLLLSLLLFGLLLGFNDRIIIPSIIFSFVATIPIMIVNRRKTITKSKDFWSTHGSHIEVSLAPYDFVAMSRAANFVYYEQRTPLSFAPRILVVQREATVEINGPWAILQALARDNPALLDA